MNLSLTHDLELINPRMTFLNERWTFVKLYPQKNDFWAPDEDRTRNLLMPGGTLWPLSYQDSDGELKCKFKICATWAV